MNTNDTANQLEMAKKEISKLQSELESVKNENEQYKQQELINSLKKSTDRHGW